MGLDNPLHIAILVVILLLVFGAKRLPEMGRSIGSGLRGFKETINGDGQSSHADALAPQSAFAPDPSAPTREQPQPAQPRSEEPSAPAPSEPSAPARSESPPAEHAASVRTDGGEARTEQTPIKPAA